MSYTYQTDRIRYIEVSHTPKESAISHLLHNRRGDFANKLGDDRLKNMNMNGHRKTEHCIQSTGLLLDEIGNGVNRVHGLNNCLSGIKSNPVVNDALGPVMPRRETST